ncbi:fumarylacetoacetase [Sphingomicrobium astaxanthinifaciens]|uniref:fumarylacetoacetase n=1 Tax=Sphingomicrobium astaxanthinifaciens TaxID=1227949 RepID=UPI001FCB420C|nr:fumarylacetoacetase [Sphingomicrobium astaxanthinifaciens]MCJ7421429.1 fumarylacetoacetase [Sphingomicrobium astaxanthinifaciens]
MQTDPTISPDLDCWVEGANGHPDWPVQNLPLGVFSSADGLPRIGTAIGDYVLDLDALAQGELIADEDVREALQQPMLNALFALGAEAMKGLRARLSQLLTDSDYRAAIGQHLIAMDEVEMELPALVGDYTDFYVGIHHATNVGKLFRPDNPLLPNYKHIPIGYHGRASSVRVSGHPVVRPSGQKRPSEEGAAPTRSPSARLDYELEMGIWVGEGNALGDPIPIEEAENHIAGYCLLNDWSARDLQAWEYQPLGPFLAKSFLTTVSPWVVTPQALAPYMKPMPPRPEGDPQPIDYLAGGPDKAALGIALEVLLSTEKMRRAGDAPHRLSEGEAAAAMYWSAAQIVTHHASNGCNLQPGDLIGTGTLSTAEESGYGSLLELSEGGKKPISLPNGETRTFLEDGDEVTLRARAVAEGQPGISLGECTGRVLPARG